MSKDSTNQALKQIRAIYTLGPLGGMTDARLIERFLDRAGPNAEDAFAALVQRHGPMVLGVCRRMLPGSADAEDAFQAVFLVLARRADSIRRIEGLKSWLYGVAVRTAKESRRCATRRKAREGGAMDLSRVANAPDESKRELLALLDEELHRLPGRYRDPLLLCELAGTSRQDAARHLGLPEGTLSSRLSRGRSLLRDRLVRRGVALGTGTFAGLAAEPASASFPEPLVESTARLALAFTTRGAAAGTIPSAVASLAAGVLTMIAHAKLKLTLASLVLGMVGLTFALAEGPKPEKAAVPVTAVKNPSSTQVEARGIVVDEAGRPVAGVEVLAGPFTITESRGVTGADGTFVLPMQRKKIDGSSLLAHSANNDRLGYFKYGFRLTEAEAQSPARIILKPGREVIAHVVDEDKTPIADATVEAVGDFVIPAKAKTAPDGSARLVIPIDAGIESILAVKSRRGFDFAGYGVIDPSRMPVGIPASELPETVSLTLDGARTIRLKAIDRAGKPLTGIVFYPTQLEKAGRLLQRSLKSRSLAATTGADGIATFDWLPSKTDAHFLSMAEGYIFRLVTAAAGETEVVTTTFVRSETIRGRVVRPDGQPARDIRVYAAGFTGPGKAGASGQTTSDGSYVLTVNPDEVYTVKVEDKDWAAPPRFNVAVREGKPADGVDFTLSQGTNFHGTITAGPANRPMPGINIVLIQPGEKVPDDLRKPNGTSQVRQMQRNATTDAAGHYSIRLTPGTYTLINMPRMKDETIIVKDEAEIVRNYHLARPEKGPLSGRVVMAGTKDKGVAGARVEILSAGGRMAFPLTVIADKEGRFQTERGLDKTYLCAHSSDGSLGGMAEIDDEAKEVVITVAPTASATGILLDKDGKHAANEEIVWGRRVVIEEDRHHTRYAFVPKVKTDANGRFTLLEMVVGQDYPVSIMRDRHELMACVVHPDKSGPIDLGTVQAGTYTAILGPKTVTYFRRNAPGVGKLAPAIKATTLDGKPLNLDAFKNKYILIYLWVTWSRPCIDEIPRLKAIHEEFGNDGRFTILSLSVDEKIDAPKTFQAKRKLPWAQAFLGDGIHGPQPARFGIIAIPAYVLIGPDGKIVARGMRGDDIKKEVAKALGKTP